LPAVEEMDFMACRSKPNCQGKHCLSLIARCSGLCPKISD
jgi:hypothetical protein